MSMHDIFTEMLKHYLRMQGLKFVKLEEEIRIFMRGKPDLSILIEDAKILENISDESWMYIIKKCAQENASIVLIEVKTERTTGIHIYQLYRYKMSLILSEEKSHREICAVLIGPEIGEEENIRRTLALKTGLQIHITKEKFFYIIQLNSVQIYAIPFESLNPKILDNALLLLFSKKRNKAIKAAKELLTKIPRTSILYTLTLFIVPGIKVPEREIPPENIAKAVDVIGIERFVKAIDIIGIERFAKAIGPERLAKAIDIIGIERFAKAIGPERLAKMLKFIDAKQFAKLLALMSERELIEVLRHLPVEKKKLIAKIIANS